MAKVDFALVRREIKDAARRAFDAVQQTHADETFYAFALYSDDSAMTVCPSANTEQGYERCVKRYKADKSYMEFIASHRIPFEGCLSNFRWGTAEWAYECEGHEHFGTVYEMINVDDTYDDEDPEGFVNFKGRVFASMVLGLKDLNAEGYFGARKARPSVTLLCSVSDSGCAVWLEEESARRLNPSAVFEMFWSERTRDRSIKEDFRSHRRSPDSVHGAFVRQLKRGR
jgi:hypothetical protein